MKTSIAFYRKEAKKSPKTGKTPIYLLICMMGKKSETRLNAELSADQMLKWDSMTMRIAGALILIGPMAIFYRQWQLRNEGNRN